MSRWWRAKPRNTDVLEAMRDMSIQYRLNDRIQPGFIASVDPRAARRQFHVSLGVAAALMVAIGGAALTLRPVAGFDAASQRAAIADAAALHHHDYSAIRVSDPAGG